MVAITILQSRGSISTYGPTSMHVRKCEKNIGTQRRSDPHSLWKRPARIIFNILLNDIDDHDHDHDDADADATN